MRMYSSVKEHAIKTMGMYYITTLRNNWALYGKFSVTQIFYSWVFIQEQIFHMYQKASVRMFLAALFVISFSLTHAPGDFSSVHQEQNG